MNFKLVLSQIIQKFESEKLEYGLIGGIAIGILGVNRATADLDFLVHHDDMEKVGKIMNDLGYHPVFHNEIFSLYQSGLKAFGNIDFVHAKNETIRKMLADRKNHKIFDDSLEVAVITVEDIIGLKLQAIKNDKSRSGIDESDIVQLLGIHQGKIDITKIRGYAEKLEMTDTMENLMKKAEA